MAQDFYFAWVANGNTTFGVGHQVHDEAAVGLNIDHAENGVAMAKLVVRNPRVGLLNPGRKQWCWISWRKPDDTVVPLFHGRLVGMPVDIAADLVALSFVARPADYQEQKIALAATLKVPPYWDINFLDEKQQADPDSVLLARPALWHVGRTDKLVTISDILAGEDGTVVLGPGDVIGKTLSMGQGSPIPKVHMVVTVEWQQAATGSLNMEPLVTAAFAAAGGSAAGMESSYTGNGLETTWPVYGASIGGGWSVDISHPGLTNTDIKKAQILKVDLNPANDVPPDGVLPGTPEYEDWLRERMSDPVKEADFARWDFRPTFRVRYAANRARKEVLDITVLADSQALVADVSGDEQITELKLQSTTIGDADKTTGVKPIGNARNNSYFDSDRGQDSIAYALSFVRSYILFAARAIDITIGIPFETAVQLSCRKDVILSLPELPGGVAGGKITSYQMSWDQSGTQASVTFSCVIGKGNALDPPEAGVPSYVDDDYVEDDYQIFYGQSLQPVAGAISYTRPHYTPNDDGIDFNNLTPQSVLKDIQATALLTFTGPGANLEEVHIGPRTYTLKTGALSANDVKVGADEDETTRNIAAAINRDEDQEGVTFGAGTLAHASVLAAAQDGILRATARVGGVAGNSIAVSETSAVASWDTPTLTSGSQGLVVVDGPATQVATMSADPEPGSTKIAIARLNSVYTRVRLGLKTVTGGPFQTDITLDVEPFMVPKTIDLEAAP